jgi:hypothetical protein
MASITCPVCGRVSHHPKDIAEGYCGACHDWTTPPMEERLMPRPRKKIMPPDQLIARLVDWIRPLLADHPPEIQAGVLADLVAIWLAGHFAGDKTTDLRETLLKLHIEAVRKLIPINEAHLLHPPG